MSRPPNNQSNNHFNLQNRQTNTLQPIYTVEEHYMENKQIENGIYDNYDYDTTPNLEEKS